MNYGNLLVLCVIFAQFHTDECRPSQQKETLVEKTDGEHVRNGDRLRRQYYNTPPACSPRVSCASCKCHGYSIFTGWHCCECNPCFPAAARLSLENGETLPMSEIEIGDRVQTVTSDGSVIFSEVRGFMEKQLTGISNYKIITTSTNSTISLSGNHLIYTRKSLGYTFHPIYADQISMGDEVLIENSQTITPKKVVDVSSQMMQGAYVPLTMEGNIIVEGVLASCYASIHHDIAHYGMIPIRWFPAITNWIFGEDREYAVYVQMTEELGKWMCPNSLD